MGLKPLNSNYRPNVGSMPTVKHRRRWYRKNATYTGSFSPSKGKIVRPGYLRKFYRSY